MKAAVCRAFDAPLEIADIDLRPPGPGEVEVAIAACAVCHSDLHAMDGAWGGYLPAVYGHEAAGHVTAIGKGVADIAKGDAGAGHTDPRLRNLPVLRRRASGDLRNAV